MAVLELVWHLNYRADPAAIGPSDFVICDHRRRPQMMTIKLHELSSACSP